MELPCITVLQYREKNTLECKEICFDVLDFVSFLPYLHCLPLTACLNTSSEEQVDPLRALSNGR